MLVNQWANVVRWELRTRMFLRTTEFLWQEGHTAHSNHEEAIEEVLRILDIYAEVAERHHGDARDQGRENARRKIRRRAAQLFHRGHDAERPGAAGRAPATILGQNFGKAFDVQFQSKEGQLDYVWQTSWGVSTRLIGGLIMTHSDDKGLVLPPKLAPVKAVLVPIYRKDQEKDAVLEAAHRIAKEVGAKVDEREGLSPGAKFFHWERRGVPVVLELGPRDLASGNIVLKRRDTGAKEIVPADGYRSAIARKCSSKCRRTSTPPPSSARRTTRCWRIPWRKWKRSCAEVSAEKGGGKFVMAHLKDDPAVRRPHEGIQSHRALHPDGGRIRRRREVHRHRRDGGPARGDRQGLLMLNPWLAALPAPGLPIPQLLPNPLPGLPRVPSVDPWLRIANSLHARLPGPRAASPPRTFAAPSAFRTAP